MPRHLSSPRRIVLARAAVVLGVWLCTCERAIDAQEASKPAEGPAGLERLRAAASGYHITLDATPPRPLVLRAEPALHWSNPLRKTNDGATFLWISRGRPEVVASFYRYRGEGRAREDHEFQSLATTGLTAEKNGRDVWFPKAPGVTLAPIPGAPVPASSPPERLRQMRSLARQFKAFFDTPKDQSELRLLTNPIYRYEAERPDLADGALFAFVQTTDPEVLLLIEARPLNGAPAWHYGLARMSMVNLRAEHKDQPVWRAEWDYGDNPGKPYLTIPVPLEELEAPNP